MFQLYRYTDTEIDKLKKAQLVKERANEIIDDYQDQMDPAIYDGAKREIENADLENANKEEEQERKGNE